MNFFLSTRCMATNAFSKQKWKKFKMDFKKNYKNEKVEQRCFNIFDNNLSIIENHNAKYRNGQESYYLAINQFADKSPKAFATRLSKMVQPSLNFPFVSLNGHGVGDSKDWRESNAVLSVDDQGECGSCWAFSVLGALEGQLAIHRNQRIKLSAQQLVDCSEENCGCEGGWIDSAFSYIQENGICSESSYPYTGKEGVCKVRSGSKVLNTISDYKLLPIDENYLKTAIWNIGPISVTVNATHWQLYGGGIFHNASSSSTVYNHAALAVGYGSDDSDYWIIKNSWGTTWGENGYIRLKRGMNHCGIANFAVYPIL